MLIWDFAGLSAIAFGALHLEHRITTIRMTLQDFANWVSPLPTRYSDREGRCRRFIQPRMSGTV